MKSRSFYRIAKEEVINLGYSREIEWQANQFPHNISESEFLREAAWVVYCSGFRETTVRRYFNFISLCFLDWQSASEIIEAKNQCIAAVMPVLRNRKKHDAVVEIASRVAASGFDQFKAKMLARPIETLQELPFIGPVTSLHLAKNLGFDVAKPDRHLLRLKAYLGFPDVETMCDEFARESGDPVRVVDVVLWRYLERQGASAYR